MHPFSFNGFDIVIFCDCNGNFSALEDQCSHEDVPLSQGEYENNIVTCLAHGARFDTASGRHLCLPAVTDVKQFEVRLHDGKVFVYFPDDAST